MEHSLFAHTQKDMCRAECFMLQMNVTLLRFAVNLEC